MTIPKGYEEVDPSTIKEHPEAQLVDGKWVTPIYGCDSLQMALDHERYKTQTRTKRR